MKCEPLLGVQGLLSTQNLSNLKEVWRLDRLIQAHTLLAVMTNEASPEHQLNLLRAYTFVLQIWQVLCLHDNIVLSFKSEMMRMFFNGHFISL